MKPRVSSNFSAALIRPRFPSLIRSGRLSLVLVLLGYRDHETQVGLGQLFERFLIAFADSLGQFHLFLHRDELLLADLLQIFVERGALAVGDGFCNF